MKGVKEEFDDVAARNKAFLMYASHLQGKIDGLKREVEKVEVKDPSRQVMEVKDALVHSRKLLNMKLNQQR